MNPVNESAIQRAIASDPLAGTREGWDRDIAEGYHNCPQCGQGHQSEDQGLIGRLRLYLKGVVEQRDELAASIIEMAPRTDVVFVQAKRTRRTDTRSQVGRSPPQQRQRELQPDTSSNSGRWECGDVVDAR